MNDIKKQSRIAALLYFLNGFPAPFALLYVPSVLIVRGDALATANNVRNSEALLLDHGNLRHGGLLPIV